MACAVSALGFGLASGRTACKVTHDDKLYATCYVEQDVFSLWNTYFMSLGTEVRSDRGIVGYISLLADYGRYWFMLEYGKGLSFERWAIAMGYRW